ncbi:MAG: polyribonucleotide nucleotidyltransferase, partial [Patescibacteria group bacterium]|nr:polyribonucleotide nucleotidyltransferase [Patescibacteria group bacterium]
MENKTYKIDIGNKELIVETNKMAEQANADVLVRYGDTVVLVTSVMSKNIRPDIDFFPLSVDYEEKFYAAGKILGARYIRRESRPTDEAILTARLIDRTIRPKFPKDLKNEIQIIATCLSWDAENDPDILGLLGASIALSISDIPWQGPVVGLRIGKIGDEFVINPNYEQRENSSLDLTISAVREDNKILINMIEAEAKETDEEIILNALAFANPFLNKLFDFQEQIIKEVGKEKKVIETIKPDNELEKEIQEFLKNKLEKAVYSKNKEQEELKQDLCYFIEEKYNDASKVKFAKNYFDKQVQNIVRKNILEKEQRIDNRKLDEIRDISAEVGLLPRTHGSGLFRRGQTKTLSLLTLGAPGDQRLLDGMEIRGKKRFMHHYNFPPFSVGETRFMRGPSRRDIGHGMLVEKALLSLVPNFKEFPYTIRIVSETLSSNGSSSMASLCSSSLSLMDAGVPIKRPVAGIAMGLIARDASLTDYKILSDIQGPEDHYGDMDLKVAGTEKGITAIQMDVKISGINEEIMKQALIEAKKRRQDILSKIKQILPEHRSELSEWAPKIKIIQINPEKIRDVIGTGGKVINSIIEECGVLIDIEDDGTVFITAEKDGKLEKAVEWVKNITREIKVGEIFEGKVKRILNFGAFVEVLPGQEGLVHISKLSDKRIEKVEDVVKIGDSISVKVISIDDQGRINLSK